MNIIGDVRGRNCIVVDDLIDTAGTLVKGAEALIKAGTESVSACATHPVLSGPAVKRIQEAPIREVVVTNSIPLKEEARRCEAIRSLSVAPLLARAIQSIHEGGSISTLFV
jgi:ribose-phosphate pyrophosphokinase